MLQRSLLSPDHPGSTWVVFATPGGLSSLHPHMLGVRTPGLQTPTHQPLPRAHRPLLARSPNVSSFHPPSPGSLLTTPSCAVQLLIHLLLKSSQDRWPLVWACSREKWAGESSSDCAGSLPPTGIRAYEQLGYRAFRTPGKLAAALAITCRTSEVKLMDWLAVGGGQA